MLLVSCLCTQYSYCESTLPGHHNGLPAVLGRGSNYCRLLDEPLGLPVAVALTMAVLGLWSFLFARVFRHGILLIEVVRRQPKVRPHNQDPSEGIGLDKPADSLKEEAMRRLFEQRPSMSAWYSTNLAHTVGLMFVQFKIFLGRFDVRTMRAALAGVHRPEEAGPTKLFEGQEDVWFDFVADTGDGFNSTYHVARSLAQPALKVQVPSKRILRGFKQRVGSMFATSSGRFKARSSSSAAFDLNDLKQDSEPHLFRRQNSGPLGVGETEYGELGPDGCLRLPRGSLMLHGGDLAYPHPSLEVYEQRLILPYEAALAPPAGANLTEVSSKRNAPSATLAKESGAPLCWMIPGNHDWFDGLETFLHTICGRHWFGGWHLPQTNTYWALELPHNWFVLGFDLGLNDDMDDLQYSYFTSIIKDLPANANVITITHGPRWFTDSYYRRESGRMYRHLLTSLGSKLRLLMAGDIHHYSRHAPKSPDGGPDLIISGGGGAFLHPTHIDPEVPGYKRVSAYPSPAISRALALRNPLQFRRRNWAFEILLGTFMVLMVAPALPLCGDAEDLFVVWKGGEAGFLRVLTQLVCRTYVRILETTTVALLAQAGMMLFMLIFVEGQWGEARRLLWGVPLATAMSVCTVGVVCGMELAILALGAEGYEGNGPGHRGIPAVITNMPHPWSDFFEWFLPILLYVVDLPMRIYDVRLMVCSQGVASAPRSLLLLYDILTLPYFWILATPVATFIFGTYLAMASVCGRHVDEAFSSLRIENYKNFLKMHLEENGGLHIYSIGIGWVSRHWAEDDLWRRENNSSRHPAQRSAPSRWRPKSGDEPHLVDYLYLAPNGVQRPTRTDGEVGSQAQELNRPKEGCSVQ